MKVDEDQGPSGSKNTKNRLYHKCSPYVLLYLSALKSYSIYASNTLKNIIYILKKYLSYRTKIFKKNRQVQTEFSVFRHLDMLIAMK